MYFYYDSETGDFAGTSEILKPGLSYTTVEAPVCDHGDAYPDYVEKAVFDEVSNTWTKVAI